MLFTLAATTLASHLLVLLAPALLPPHILGTLPIMLLAFLGLAIRRCKFRFAATVAAIFVVGLLNASGVAQSRLDQQLPPGLDGQKVWVEGRIASLPRIGERSISFILDEAVARNSGSLRLPRRIQVSWFGSGRVPAAGDTWRFHLRLKRPGGALNPAGRDMDGWFFRENIGARASVVKGDARRVPEEASELGLLRMRGRLARTIRQQLDGHPLTGVLVGLAVGIRDLISPGQWRVLAATGTGHLVAISGLHVGLIAGLIFLCTRFAWGLSARLSALLAPVDAARPVALLAGASYALLAGFALPTQRALMMLTLWYGAGLLRRPMSGFQVLGLSIMAFVFADPVCILGPGFWLSFGAVATLILATTNQPTGLFSRQILTQLKVFAGIAPAGLAAFGMISVTAPLANLFMIPFFGLVMIPMVLIATLVTQVSPFAGEILLKSCANILYWLWPLLENLAEADELAFTNSLTPWLAVGVGVAGCLFLLPSWPGKRVLLTVCMVAVLGARRELPPPGGLSATILDVGHALSVVVRTRRHVLLYDLGAGRGDYSDFQQILQPYLKAVDASSPDVLVLSHDDSRHLGDARAFVQRYPGPAIISGAPTAVADRVGVGRVTRCHAGMAWNWDGVSFSILHPARNNSWEDDDDSCVLLIKSPAIAVLLTGDLSARGERRMLARYPQLRADVVVGLAHGRVASSSEGLVSSLGASIAVVSTRSDNPWGLPAAAVLKRWSEHGTLLLNTGDKGAVSIQASEVWRYSWQRAGRLWYRK